MDFQVIGESRGWEQNSLALCLLSMTCLGFLTTVLFRHLKMGVGYIVSHTHTSQAPSLAHWVTPASQRTEQKSRSPLSCWLWTVSSTCSFPACRHWATQGNSLRALLLGACLLQLGPVNSSPLAWGLLEFSVYATSDSGNLSRHLPWPHLSESSRPFTLAPVLAYRPALRHYLSPDCVLTAETFCLRLYPTATVLPEFSSWVASLLPSWRALRMYTLSYFLNSLPPNSPN